MAQQRLKTPGWPEISVGLLVYALLLGVFLLMMGLLGQNDPVSLGVVGSMAGGFAGTGAFIAAFSIRLRKAAIFGFRRTSVQWLIVGGGLGVVGYGFSIIIKSLYAAWISDADPQGILHAAAQGGTVPFIISLIGGALFTPFGEEILFRGVVANGLNRFGAFNGVAVSALIFGIAHGVSVILPIAIMIGALTAVLFRATGSVLPCVTLHCIYNGLNSVASAVSSYFW